MEGMEPGIWTAIHGINGIPSVVTSLIISKEITLSLGN